MSYYAKIEEHQSKLEGRWQIFLMGGVTSASKSTRAQEGHFQKKITDGRKKWKNNKTKLLRKRSGASECWFWSFMAKPFCPLELARSLDFIPLQTWNLAENFIILVYAPRQLCHGVASIFKAKIITQGQGHLPRSRSVRGKQILQDWTENLCE